MLKFSVFSRSARFDWRRSVSRKRRGASVIVETALCMTMVLLPLSLGTLQFGVVMSAGNQIEQVSREGARYASVHAFDANFTSDENTQGSLRYYLKNLVVAQRTALKWSDISGAPRALYTTTNPPPATNSAAGFVQIVYANGVPANGVYPLTFLVGTPAAGQSVSIRVVYPMTRKVFTGRITAGVSILSNDYISTSTFVVE